MTDTKIMTGMCWPILRIRTAKAAPFINWRKSITIGEELAIVGSFNIDMRSAYLDTELMLVIDSQEVNRQLKDYMQEYEKQSARILDAERFELPEGVKRQEITGKRAVMVKVVGLLNWLRFLM